MSITPRSRSMRGLAAVSAALVLSLSACGSDDGEIAGTGSDGEASYGEISMQYSWIKNEEFAGEFYAYENGYYDEAGFDEVFGISGPDTGVAKLLSGTVQVALSDAASVGAAIAEQDAPLKIIAATFQKNPFTILSLADGADIALPDTGVPVELDRIYRSLRDLSQALGPNGVNRDGTLDNLLRAGDEALSGQGERGNRMIRELSAAATTFGEGSGDLFDTVTELATFTGTLAENDRLVRAFLQDLTGVSADLADERQEISAALAAVARAVGSVEDFVGDNREALVTDVEKLTRVVKNLDSERDSLDTALTVAPVAMGNLALAFNNESNSIGSRIGIGGNVWDADGFLCGIVQQAGLPRVSADLACELFEMLLEPVTTQLPFIPPEHSGRPSGTANRPAPGGADLADLLAGGR